MEKIDKTKEQPQNEVKTLEKRITELEAKLMDFEETKKDLIKSERFLSQTALELEEMHSDANIYEFIAKKLNKFVANSIIAINAYDEASDSFRVRSVIGENKRLNDFSQKFLGVSLLNISVPISAFNEANDEEEKKRILSGKPIILKKGLYQVLAGTLPQKLARIVEIALDMGDIYGSGFKRDDKLYGSVNIFLKKGNKLENKNTVETFIRLASVALQRREAEIKLKESENRYKAIFENTGASTIIFDKNGIILIQNSEMEKMTGYSKEEVEGKMTWMEFIPPKELKMMQEYHKKRTKDPKSAPSRYETKFIIKDGNINNAQITVDKIPGTEEYVSSITNITDLRNAEKELKMSLEEKDMLLKEIYHRTKNNLMMISSLLNLQSSYIKDKGARDVFRESQNRARSMAMIHERLYQSTDLKNIDFSEYIQTLTIELYRTIVSDPSRIKLNINVEDVKIDINTVVPLGLIVNELFTNCMKYAFPDGRSGEINVVLHQKEDFYELIVKDNGIGIPEDLDYLHAESLGLQLVNNLTDQIDGKIEMDRTNGTEFKITFKK